MTRLIVCCDGTWNTPDQREDGLPSPTNVVKFHNALAAEGGGEAQSHYYHSGVGTDGNWWDRIAGGGLGRGLDDNVKSAYHWLARAYAPGDSIWLFGFSRGAYTARSVGGMIARCGLVDLAPRDGLSVPDTWAAVDEVFEAYRARTPLRASPARPFHNVGERGPTVGTTGIRFVGVWDTVGSLGIPDDLALLDLLDDAEDHAFHDCTLSDVVQTARHAVAMDERRQTFSPTLWTDVAADRDVKQLWFPGVHGDVGGGYAQAGLSDGALRWMMTEAAEAGLAFRPGIEARLAADPLGAMHDSLTGIFRRLKKCPRAVPRLRGDGGAVGLHESALARFDGASFDHASYWATKALEDGESATCDVFAREPWNYTGIYLEAGRTYDFSAAGEWVDGTVRCGPGGTADGNFQIGELLHVGARLLDDGEAIWRRLSRNQRAELWLSRRDGRQSWFKLMGVIANGEAGDHESFPIGEGTRYTPRRGGYLYCFANDAWEAYGNNRGSVQLTVRAALPADAARVPELAAAGK